MLSNESETKLDRQGAMPEQAQLPPCPFAHTVMQGSRATDYAPYATDEFHEDGKWNVICPVCSAGTGFYDTAQEAEEAWSRRAEAAAGGGQALADYLNAATTCRSCDHDYCHAIADIRSIVAPSAVKVEDEKCVDHCSHDPRWIGMSQDGLRCLHEDEDGLCGHRCVFSRYAPDDERCPVVINKGTNLERQCKHGIHDSSLAHDYDPFPPNALRPASEPARRAAERIVKQFPEIGILYAPDVAEIIQDELTKE